MALSLDILQQRLRTLIPAQYQQTPAKPASMGSAGLKYKADGTVAWDKIWGSFCDLALAGGPPHKGTLLQPGTDAEIAANAGPYQQVVREVCRGVGLVTGLDAESDAAGWVRVSCTSNAMAGWLLRAITAENIAARAKGNTLYLPAGPEYRLDKQIKNVITVSAKTVHYWRDHMPVSQQWEIADLFVAMEAESPLLKPADCSDEHFLRVAHALRQRSFTVLPARYSGWVGVTFATPQEAVDAMRVAITQNVLARREDDALYLPLDSVGDPEGTRLFEPLRIVCSQSEFQQYVVRRL